jgi:hypothetical protein
MDQVANLKCQNVVTTLTCTAALRGCANTLAMQVCPCTAAWQRSRAGPCRKLQENLQGSHKPQPAALSPSSY